MSGRVRGSGNRCGSMRCVTLLFAVLLAVAGPSRALAQSDGDGLWLECPCTIEGDGASLQITAGLSNFFSDRASGRLRLRVGIWEEDGHWSGSRELATVTLDRDLEPAERREARIYIADLLDADAGGSGYLYLSLEAWEDGSWSAQDWVRMELRVDPAQAFEVGDLDYLKDSDGDGVGDANERLMGTDPTDADDRPEDEVVIDVLAMHYPEWSLLWENQPQTRVAHMFSLANAMLADSGARLRFRPVGLLSETGLDENTGLSAPATAVMTTLGEEAERHGADLAVLFTRGTWGYCGLASINSHRGHLSDQFLAAERKRSIYASVFGRCGAS